MRQRTGVWLVGARGSVATTAIVGAAAVGAGLAAPTGLVLGSPWLPDVGPPALIDLVFGGHDTNDVPLPKRVEQLVQAGVVPPHIAAAVHQDVAATDAELRILPKVGERNQADAAHWLIEQLQAFGRRQDLHHVVVVNVASTEPRPNHRPEHHDLPALERALRDGENVLPASSLAAYAAFTAGCSFVDFTPSPGPRLPALDQLARMNHVPYAGSDGKTGETLVKSVLAPMFATRGLVVKSWSGTNLLGGGDGANLDQPEVAASKLASKRRPLTETLGYQVDGPLHIDYLADLGEWKTAWDHVSFEGFLGVRMTLQFTWQGCDSALAAPLVLDLARLTAKAYMAGEVGPLAPLAFFFKDPIASCEHRLAQQYEALRTWAVGLERIR